MGSQDVVCVLYLIYLIRNHPSMPVTIQQNIEIDAAGDPVDVETFAVIEISDAPPPTREEQEAICSDCRAEHLACVAEILPRLFDDSVLIVASTPLTLLWYGIEPNQIEFRAAL
jgi:hypothetical protein